MSSDKEQSQPENYQSDLETAVNTRCSEEVVRINTSRDGITISAQGDDSIEVLISVSSADCRLITRCYKDANGNWVCVGGT